MFLREVHKQAAAGFRHIQVILEEALDGEQGLLIQAFDAALLEFDDAIVRCV